MSAVIPLVAHALSNDVTVQEALSGIFGSISLATWIFLLVSDSKSDTKIYSVLLRRENKSV
jgi:hypothetical protein